MKNAKNAALSAKIHSAPLYTIEDAEKVIRFVGSVNDWPYCEERLRAAKIVGIDSETRPVFHGKQKSNPCSLLQLAVRCAKGKREVFVIDLLKLQPKVYNAALSKLFLSKQIIKLGQGLLSDLKDLVASYPAASCFSVAKAVVEVNDLSISLAGAHNAISLQKLAFFYINKRLTKTMQTSNWNRRPLSTSQLHYAASDALVLIDIYDELVKRLQARTGGTFKVESVMNVLDVHVEPNVKCSLCFELHDTIAELKAHRRECLKSVCSLALCVTCDEIKLLDATAMATHTSTCGRLVVDGDAEIHSPVEVGDMTLTNVHVGAKKETGARKRVRKDNSNDALSAQPQKKQAKTQPSNKHAKAKPVATPATDVVIKSTSELSKRKRKNKNKKKAKQTGAAAADAVPSSPPPMRARKMSAGTLLAADDIWSEISSNLVSDQPSP